MTTAVERLGERRISKREVGELLQNLSKAARRTLPERFLNFLDVAGSATSRASYYSTKDEVIGSTKMAHASMLAAERGVYAASLCLPGATHFNRQLGMMTLLSMPRVGDPILSEDQERMALDYVVGQLPVSNILRTAMWMIEGKMNSQRTRKLLFRHVIKSPSFSFWCLKYRSKMRRLLRHLFGSDAMVRKFVAGGITDLPNLPRGSERLQMARFALGWDPKGESGLCDYLTAFYAAREKLEDGAALPREILEGIRGRYHSGTPSGRVLEIAKGAKTITGRDAMRVQRKAQEAGVEVEVDWKKQDAVPLYLYAYERGMTAEIQQALEYKAEIAAAGLPISFEKLAIIVDYSDSMRGSKTQKLRPMACAMATRDMLMKATDTWDVFATAHPGGRPTLPRPNGHTDLATSLVRALKAKPDAVAMITDGYENAPAGGVDQVMSVARRLGVETPVYQLTPVMSAETASIRKLSGLISAMPVYEPKSLGVGLLKSAFEASLEQGVQALLNTVMPLLEG